MIIYFSFTFIEPSYYHKNFLDINTILDIKRFLLLDKFSKNLLLNNDDIIITLLLLSKSQIYSKTYNPNKQNPKSLYIQINNKTKNRYYTLSTLSNNYPITTKKYLTFKKNSIYLFFSTLVNTIIQLNNSNKK